MLGEARAVGRQVAHERCVVDLHKQGIKLLEIARIKVLEHDSDGVRAERAVDLRERCGRLEHAPIEVMHSGDSELEDHRIAQAPPRRARSPSSPA